MTGWIIGTLVVIFIVIKIQKFRKMKKFEEEIIDLILFWEDCKILTDIDYQIARKYAIRYGTELGYGSDDSINFRIKMDERSYFVYFSKIDDESIYVGVSDADEMDNAFKKAIAGDSTELNKIINKSL